MSKQNALIVFQGYSNDFGNDIYTIIFNTMNTNVSISLFEKFIKNKLWNEFLIDNKMRFLSSIWFE